MKLIRKELEGKLGALALSGAQRYLVRKPIIRAERFGEALGRGLYRLSRKHRERALRNLELAFPAMSPAERIALSKLVFEHFGRIAADFMASGQLTKEELDRSCEIVGLEHLRSAQSVGKGVLLITGHFGNWERAAAWMSSRGYKLGVVARDTSESATNELLQRLRSASGTDVISRGNSTRRILEKLRRNEMVAILPDQNSGEAYLPFFGKLAGTVLGPGVLHERTGAPVIPAWCVWLGPGRYRIMIEPALTSQPGFSIKGEGMMRSINDALERIIRQYPEQWLWFHDRWKNARQKGLI